MTLLRLYGTITKQYYWAIEVNDIVFKISCAQYEMLCRENSTRDVEVAQDSLMMKEVITKLWKGEEYV